MTTLIATGIMIITDYCYHSDHSDGYHHQNNTSTPASPDLGDKKTSPNLGGKKKNEILNLSCEAT